VNRREASCGLRKKSLKSGVGSRGGVVLVEAVAGAALELKLTMRFLRMS